MHPIVVPAWAGTWADDGCGCAFAAQRTRPRPRPPPSAIALDDEVDEAVWRLCPWQLRFTTDDGRLTAGHWRASSASTSSCVVDCSPRKTRY
jgi:hypothetical protein